MSNFSKNESLMYMSTAGLISGITTLILKIFMMYNLWQDVFTVSGIAATFKNMLLYILFISSNWVPISLSLMKYLGVQFNFTISSVTIWLAVFAIISEAFLNTLYKEYKKQKVNV